MLIQVGNKWGEYLVTHIGEVDYICVAKDNSSNWSSTELARHSNVTYMSVNVEDYVEGDVIHVEEQSIRLEKEGLGVKYIITRRKVTKLYAGSNDAETINQPETPSVEGTGTGSEGREGTGIESLSQDYSAAD